MHGSLLRSFCQRFSEEYDTTNNAPGQLLKYTQNSYIKDEPRVVI